MQNDIRSSFWFGPAFFSLLLCLPAKAALTDLNSYAALPCATSAEYDELTAEIKLTATLEGKLCGDSHRAKFGKLLKLARSLKVTLPADWEGGAAAALADPLAYLKDMNRSFNLDLSQPGSIAYNRSQGDIFLGSTFFEEDPLMALETLVHESRHSSANAPGHIRCKQGDIPLSDRACDEWFRVDQYSGAYAYAASFAFGLGKYGPSLTSANREFLIASALAKIGTRFNFVPEFLARPFDVLVVLDENGTLSYVHPFLGTLVPTGVSLPNGEKITRIEFNNSTNGVTLFTDKRHVFSWRLGQTPQRWRLGQGQDGKIIDTASLNFGESTRRHVLTATNKIFFLSWNLETGKSQVESSPLELGSVDGIRLLNAGQDQRYLTATDGILYYWNGQTDTLKASKFQADGGWTHNTTGVLYEDLFGIDQKGTLYYRGESGRTKSTLQAESGAVKYVEGTNLRAVLDREGKLVVRHYGSKRTANFGGGKSSARIVDVAIPRNFVNGTTFPSLAASSAEFAKKCGLTQSGTDPWLHTGIGLDRTGKLVFEGDEKNPCLVDSTASAQGGWAHFDYAGTKVSASEYPYTSVSLTLTDGKGRTKAVVPY